VNKHLIPGLGRHQLHKLGPQEVQAFINEKAVSGLGVKSIKIVRDTLRVALNDAMKWDLVRRNVAPLVTLPRSEKTEKRVWSISEALAFLAAVQSDRLEAVFQLALCFGAREGEILALQWTDMDFEAGFVYIRATQQRVGGKLVSGSPKTGSSRRRIPFTPRLRELLAARKRAQDEERQWAAGDWEETGMVFTTSRGTRLDVSNLMRCYRAAVKRARAEYFLKSALDRASSEGKERAGFWLACQLRYADLTLSAAQVCVRRFQQSAGPADQQQPYTWQDADRSLRQAYGSPQDEPNSETGAKLPPAQNQVEYIPFHRLRHTAASLMHEAGFPDQDIAKILGHSTFRTTEDFYLHSTPDAEARIARELDKLFSPVAVNVAVKGGEGKPN
jgi:integrase